MKSVKPKKIRVRKTKKIVKDITTTSVAFKTENLEALRAHELVVKDDQSVSWIINKMIEKFLDGEFTIK